MNAPQQGPPGPSDRRLTISVPTPFGGCFILLWMGRSSVRTIDCMIDLGVMVALYIVKSALGIDLFAAKSFLQFC